MSQSETIIINSLAGDAPSQLELGRRYAQGRDGVEQNLPEAVRWVRKATDSGLPEATVEMGRMYEQGRGVSRRSCTLCNTPRSPLSPCR